ncbi:MAG: peptide deformylase [Ruminococcaceae bacterium]|nr:peptide deformylase [Oscillospiraceae bacterium]
MAILNILKTKDDSETLRKKSRPVDIINERILTLLDDMKETLKQTGGVGLAAPQVGVLRRVVVIDDGENLVEMINPVIVEQCGEQEDVEGCLSIPGQWGYTKRPAKVVCEALDRNGNKFRIEGTELLARCLCHETDHLDGILYTDKVTRMLSEEEVEQLG